MSISVLDIFSIGIGPSSSHTVGPMRAAKRFAEQAIDHSPSRITVEVFGSLALTGLGHGTDKAIIGGLEGLEPETVDPHRLVPRLNTLKQQPSLNLLGQQSLPFTFDSDFMFHKELLLPHYNNGMRFNAFDEHNNLVLEKIYYSIGGGFVLAEDELNTTPEALQSNMPYPFASAKELLALCELHQLTICELVMANEDAIRPRAVSRKAILELSNVMQECITAGCHAKGILPGGLNVKRRAAALYEQLQQKHGALHPASGAEKLNWLNVYAIAVNEENAAGMRVVTAPTNGAAGIIPAVLKYILDTQADANDQTIIEYLTTATAIAILYKKGASISGAEVGCQGEIGVAASMAAGALTACLGGSLNQIENAAEIAMEHHLGMTCDPIGGLVQIPCIERNAMGAVKAINSANLALLGDGSHFVTLDQVIKTMLETGRDMHNKYKETSTGGLAVNVIEC